MAQPPRRKGTYPGDVEQSDNVWWSWTGSRWIPSGALTEDAANDQDDGLGGA